MKVELRPIKELEQRFGVSQRTIYRWIRTKKLPVHKVRVNGHNYYYEEEIVEWEKKYFGRTD